MPPADPSTPPPFPTAAALGVLTVAGLAAAATAYFLADPRTPGGEASWGPPAAIGAATVAVVSLLALVPVARMAPRGPLPAAQSFMLSLAIRLLITLAAGLVGTLSFGLPARPFLLSLASVYLVLLAVEVAFISRYLNRAYPPPGAA